METLPESNGARPVAEQVASLQTTLNDAAAILADRERRRDHRRPAIVKATLTILDGAAAGATHEVLFDPTGPRHVMAIDMEDYHAALAALEQA